MAKKKKPKQQRTRRLQQKRTRRAQRRSYTRLKRRLDQGPVDDYQLLVEPKGQVKMSALLESFVEPYLEKIDEDEKSFRKLLTLGALAWNAALLPRRERKQMIDKFVETTLEGAPAKAKRDFRGLVNTMVRRKLTHFAEYERAILDFELTDTGNGYYLSVVATVDDPGRSDCARRCRIVLKV
jgi:hypothetical protein